MNAAEPIAIVGRGCVLPGCLTLDALWQAVISDQNLLTPRAALPNTSTSQHSQLTSAQAQQAEAKQGVFKKTPGANIGVGGYIQGFDKVFTPERYSLSGVDASTLDVVVKWPLHAVSNAWREAGEPDVASNRLGVVLANLSYPTQGKTDYACSHWLNGQSDQPALNAFNSGLPAQLIAKALGATGDAFALDAACASSLYALQIACQKLQQRRLDVAVVAAVNAAHDDMLQHGFSALQALSGTGRSQPFAASADGLVPAHGAAAVVLKRLRDVRDDEQVFGVIRAVGLSNDGRRGGFLVPDSQGQLEAMHNAYQRCDVEPDSIDYLECHATGTPVGDSVEIRSASEFYAQRVPLPVGSLKSNTGHLITVAGLASLLKLTLALEHDTLPPTRIEGALNSSFEGSCLFPQTRCEPWPASRIRRAAISNFGFGGNNAHLILEDYHPATRAAGIVCNPALTTSRSHDARTSDGNSVLDSTRACNAPYAESSVDTIDNVTDHTAYAGQTKFIGNASNDNTNTEPPNDRLVICAIGALAGSDRGTDRIVRRLMCSPESVVERCTSITLDPLSVRTPPADFQHIEPQQLALLAVIDDALQQLDIDALRVGVDSDSNTMATATVKTAETLQSDRIGVFTGMGCASDACRWLLRERLDNAFGESVDAATLESLKNGVVAPMSAADVLGAMPNMPANRINAAYDFRGQGYSVSAEELSDVTALQLGCEALRLHAIDLAVVSAADFASEPVRRAALDARTMQGSADRSTNEVQARFTDKACALLLMRESTATSLGVTVLGHVAPCPDNSAVANNAVALSTPYQALIGRVYGSAPIADTLFSMVVATAMASRGQRVRGLITEPHLASCDSLKVKFSPTSTALYKCLPMQPWLLELNQAKATPDLLRPAPHLYYASADTDQQLCNAIQQRAIGGTGQRRIVVVADSEVQLVERLEQATVALSNRAGLSATDTAISENAVYASGATLTPASNSISNAASIATSTSSRFSEVYDARDVTALNANNIDGVYHGSGEPIGELAFVYTGSAAAYPRMGRGLFMSHPALASKVVDAFPSVAGVAHLLSQSSLSAYEQLCAVTLLSQAHTVLLRDVFGISPDAIIGLSLGESNALYAFGLWNDSSGLLDDRGIVSMYEEHLGGEFRSASAAWETTEPVTWTNWRIYAPVSAVELVITQFPRTDITIIYSDDDCIIGGPVEQCEELVKLLGADSGVMMNQHLIVHTPTLQPYADTWRAVHTRPTSNNSDVRVYSHGEYKSYKPTQENIADQITRQALQTIDFRKMVEQAYADGVRTFIELGPRDSLTSSVGKILGSRPHRALAVDRIDQSDARQLAEVVAALYVDGHDVDIVVLASQLEQLHHNPWTVRAARSSDINIMTGFDMPEWPQRKQGASMPCAPELPVPVFNLLSDVSALNESDSFSPAEPYAVKSVAVNVPLPQHDPRGPCFDHHALELASRGLISSLFGDAFKSQDTYSRQVRLPAPPLLMVDRITGIDAKPGVEATGTIWTETQIKADQWYLHANAMRPGPLIESGQADLSLISWMGADFQNRDERVYRLLGCEMTVHDEGLPQVGDTLCYQIEITGHAEVSGIRLFFFQYDCRVDGRLVISVRNGQAGFFTDEELASSKGVLINLADEQPLTIDPPAIDITKASRKTAFTADDLQALRDGDAFACFGEGFEHCAAHTNPPRLPTGKLVLFDEVSHFEPAGGAWGRGFLQAVATVPVDAWFYDGHFHNDPCMPGTLMAEAAVQALECLAMAMGLSCQRDGWVFEPVPGASARFECRGQVIPDRQHVLTYEVHVDQIINGDIPEIHAALVTSCDGFKVFYCPSFKIRMRREWPVPSADLQPTWIGPQQESRGDWPALLACGNGAPSDAFGEMYKPMDDHARAPRLPQPPYHMISRVLSISTRPNAPEIGATVVTEYDVSSDAWYFTDGGNGQMPFAVLLEVALQPCGWLGSHGGFALLGGECFRNLDGDGNIVRNIDAVDQCISVTATMTRFSTMGSMTIVHFDVMVDSSLGYRVMSLETSFGFFPMDALDRQVGLDTNDQQKSMRQLPATHWPIDDSHSLLAAGQMLMVDDVDFFEPSGGAAGLGLIRGFQTVDPYAWYFKAHFYQDPVQPGSLGLDALLQLMLRAIVLKGITHNLQNPRICYITPEQSLRWSYRGQVTPSAQQVTQVIEIESIEVQGGMLVVTASGSLWRDELRIYEASNLSIGIFDEI